METHTFSLQVDVSKRSAAATLFPFHTFFADAPQPLFPAESGAADAEVALASSVIAKQSPTRVRASILVYRR